MNLAASEHQDDQLLNAAITRANIKESFESYLEIVDAFYSDNVEVILGEDSEPVRGRDDLRAHLANFLVLIHVMAELGGLSVSIRSTAIPATDGAGTHSRWEATFRASSGVTRAFGWSVQRRWKDSRVNYERHYDHQVDGPPIRLRLIARVTGGAVATFSRSPVKTKSRDRLLRCNCRHGS